MNLNAELTIFCSCRSHIDYHRTSGVSLTLDRGYRSAQHQCQMATGSGQKSVVIESDKWGAAKTHPPTRMIDSWNWGFRSSMFNPLKPDFTLSSSSTTSRELLSQFSTCSGWRWFEVGGKVKKNCHVLVNQFHSNIHYKTLSCRKINFVFGDVIWCFNGSWGLNPLTAKSFNPNFHPLEVVSRWRDPQLQVSENYSDLAKWRSTVQLQILLIDVTFYLCHMFKRCYLMC